MRFRILASSHLRIVHHISRFAFVHQLEQFTTGVSEFRIKATANGENMRIPLSLFIPAADPGPIQTKLYSHAPK
jgi:hypothetical protein